MFVQTRVVPATNTRGYSVEVKDGEGNITKWLGPFPTRYQAQTAANRYELEHSDVVQPAESENNA